MRRCRQHNASSCIINCPRPKPNAAKVAKSGRSACWDTRGHERPLWYSPQIREVKAACKGVFEPFRSPRTVTTSALSDTVCQRLV